MFKLAKSLSPETLFFVNDYGIILDKCLCQWLLKKSQTNNDNYNDDYFKDYDYADTDTGFQNMAIFPGTTGLGSTSNKYVTF